MGLELKSPVRVALRKESGVAAASDWDAAAPEPAPPLPSGPDVIGRTGGLKEVAERVGIVARSDLPVLLLGETGSGKEVIARMVHQLSQRESGPFLRVNCGAIPHELIDSELFGHERGSFTGAAGQRRGGFERAHGGSLLLDECGELTPAAQVRLLRILQEGTFERVGGEQPVKVDVRIIAATHRDLGAMVRAGTFRQDLWYRLAVFPIEIPPLRDRPQDVREMAHAFTAQAADRFGLPHCAPTNDDVAMLVSYPWPGNVRELKAVIDRATILGRGRKLEVAVALGTGVAPSSLAPTPSFTAGRPGERLATLDEAMSRHIENVLIATRGQIEGPEGAARILGINPHTLRGRMRKLKIDWSRFRRPQDRFIDDGDGI
ncbi:MAG TPA: sigma-54 dependent transcriptional regulator [Planctomycetia bacterium]|nr:sigma-54 dependent transcriptional regulator [Planctomycetia bacterium]